MSKYDLVPANLSGWSAYRLFKSRNLWRKRIRPDTLQRYEGRCADCKKELPERFQCNEIWEYRDAERAAILTGFESLCDNCHWAAHIGLSREMDEPYPGLFDRAFVRYCDNNGFTPEQAEHEIARSIVKRNQRSIIPWRVIVAPDLLKSYPELRELERDLSVEIAGRESQAAS